MFIGRCALTLLTVGSLSLLGAATTTAEIYKWVDEQGRVHFQDHPPQGGGTVSGLEVRDSSPPPPPEVPPAPAAATGAARQAPAAESRAEAPPAPPRAPKVELYTVDWCPWCRKAREFFRSQGVAFTDYDVEKDPAAAARKNQLATKPGVPFAVVNGVKIHGYSPEGYTRALRSPPPESR